MLTYCVELLYRDLDLDDEVTLKALDHAGVATAERHDKSTIQVTAFVAGLNAVQAAAALAATVREFLPSAIPVMAARDLVNVTDIADRVGVSREAVRHWASGKRRAGAFPLPIDSPGGQKVWEWGSVHAWLCLNLGREDQYTYPTHAEFGSIDSFLHTMNQAT